MRTIALGFIGLLFVSGWTPERPVTAKDGALAVCATTDPPVYYAIDLVSTKRLSGTRLASGTVDMTFQSSPFGIAVGSGGHYRYDLKGRIDGLKPPRSGVYVVWLSTPNLDQVRMIGKLDNLRSFEAQVDWQKFLVIVTLEESFDPNQTRWKGPVALRGLSRSGRMHTMAGHGPFQAEPCAFFGYK